MTDEVLAPILTVLLLAALVLWVPAVAICHSRCLRLLRAFDQREQTTESPALDLTEPV